MSDSIGSRLSRLRERAGLTQAETEQLAGLCSGHVWQIERDARRSGVKTETALKLAGLFGASVEYVALGSGGEPSDRVVKAAVKAARAAVRADSEGAA